jgi:hypothetical protein
MNREQAEATVAKFMNSHGLVRALEALGLLKLDTPESVHKEGVAAPKWKVGDVVTLATGSPRMTVVQIFTTRSGPSRDLVVLLARVGRLNQRLDLLDLCPQVPTHRYLLSRIEPVLEISVAIASGATRTSCATVHAASSLAPHRRRLALSPRPCPRSTPRRLAQ